MRADVIVNSALWAAAGDALGWVTELVDQSGVQRRIGAKVITQPVQWRRLIGGRGGVDVSLPAGTYSDDTQLRLATSRSIRGNGVFDPEAFAKIELTVWQNYALGAGRGSKAAAAYLARSDTNWFSNFFRSRDLSYMSAGGNGAAMRIQPHVWKLRSGDTYTLVLDIARDSLITHGALHGIVGALIHGLSLNHCLQHSEVPSMEDLRLILREIRSLPEVLGEDRQIAAFWLPAWEHEARGSLADALSEHLASAQADLDAVSSLVSGGGINAYPDILTRLGCFDPTFRGSGTKTALAASLLALMCRDLGVEEAVKVSANTLMSDTDSIGTMVGAMLGALSATEPAWEIQDRSYIVSEALRLARIRNGEKADSHSYPDLTTWEPPQTLADAVGILPDNSLALLGLGQLREVGEEYANRDAVWQWMQLSFGQTILAKRRHKPRHIDLRLVPASRVIHREQIPSVTGAITGAVVSSKQIILPLDGPSKKSTPDARSKIHPPESRPRAPEDTSRLVDELSDRAIQSNFDPNVIGEAFNHIIRLTGSTDVAVAFSAIVAKAQVSRMIRRAR